MYGFIRARGLKARSGVWREEAARMERGPKRAPGLVCEKHAGKGRQRAAEGRESGSADGRGKREVGK